MLELQNVRKVYKTKSKDVVALDDINLYFEETGMVFITGKSGSGKTTMLNVIGGLDSFDSGKLIVKGKGFETFNQRDFDNYRNSFVGFVFQEYNLLDEMTVEKNISLAMELQGQKKDLEAINELLCRVDLEGLNGRYPSELSGGQKQRVAIARALVKKPQIILTDEPTGALDTQSGLQVMDLLKELSAERLVIIVSHNLELAHDYADRVIQMIDGRVERDYQILRDVDSDEVNIVENADKVYVRRGAKLSDDEKTLLSNGIAESKDVIVVDRRTYVEQPTKILKKNYDAVGCKFVKGRLGFSNNLKLGFSNLKIKPFRLVVTILLCAIAFSVFGLFDTMAIYDQGRLTANTLKNSNVPSVVLSASVRGENDDVSINVSQKLIDDVNSGTGMNFKGIFKLGSMIKPTEIGKLSYISKYYATAKLEGVIEFDEAEMTTHNLRLLHGKMPTEYDEIAISEYYAWCIINWGYASQTHPFVINSANYADTTPESLIVDNNPITLTINKKHYKVVGIVNAGDIDEKYDSVLADYASTSSTLTTEFSNYISNSLQMYAYVKAGFVNNYYLESFELINYKSIDSSFKFDSDATVQFTDFYCYDDLSKFENAIYYFDPEKKELQGNEILVNAYAFESMYAVAPTAGFGLNRFRTLVSNSSKYRGYDERVDEYLQRIKTSKTTGAEKIEALRNAIDLIHEVCKTDYRDVEIETKVSKYDTTKYNPDNSGELLGVSLNNDKYKIVGFYTTGKHINTVARTPYVLTKDGLDNLGINTNQGVFSSMISPATKDGAKINAIVRLVEGDNGIMYASSNNVIKIIDVNKDFLNKMSTLFLIASAVFAVFAIAMMANYIATSITNKHTEIGILRALGTSGGDVLKMFLTESIIIALINIVLSNVLTAVSCMFINDFLKNIMNISITLASYTARQFGVICAMSLGVAILASILPIVKLSRQKPIEAIRRS